MRLAVWSPLPPSRSGVADYAAEQAAALASHVEVELVADVGAVVDEALAARFRVRRADEAFERDLDLYQVGNSPEHAYVYREALRRPGVVLLHDWSLHHLVLRETVERGERTAYLREMRRAYGENGSFVGRQVARALGGELLPALYPLNERLLERSLGVVGLTRFVAQRAARRLPANRPVLHLGHHLSLPQAALSTRDEARDALGLSRQALLLTAPGLATRAKRLDLVVRAVGRLVAEWPELRLVVAGDVEPGLPLREWARSAGCEQALVATGRLSFEDFVRQLCAADVVLCLRFPSHGEMSGALVRALGVGRPVLVTGGTAAAEEFPEGVVARVDPGFAEEAMLEAMLRALLRDASLRSRMGRLAASHMRARHDLAASAASLAAFLQSVFGRREELRREIDAEQIPEGGLLEMFVQEVRWSAAELGLPGLRLGVEPLLGELLGRRP